MTDYRRETHIKRFHRKSDDGTDDPDVWVDIEVTDSYVLEQGSGVDFQRVKYTFDKDSAERRTEKKKIKNPDDDSQYVEVPVLQKILVEKGSGVDYQRTTWTFVNDEGNEQRRVRVDKVFSRDIEESRINDDANKRPVDPGSSGVDKDQFVKVEVIEEFTIETGSGVNFQRAKYRFSTVDLPGARETQT